MKRALVLQHVPFEGPARVAELLVEDGYTVDVLALHRGEPVPEDMARDDLLIVMGGPMGVAAVDDPALPFLRSEIALLKRRIAQDAPVLGLCLGAQLLAAAAGATVRRMARSDGTRLFEVGWAPVRFHRETNDALLAGIPAAAPMFHWHGDGCELPRGAHRFASSEICPNQGFRVGTRLFGLQFHCETRAVDVAALIQADLPFAELANGPDAAARLRRETQQYLAPSRAVGDRLIRNMIAVMRGATSADRS